MHNRLEASRYTGRDLEVLLVRLVFCLFADDAQIFERGAFPYVNGGLFAGHLRTPTLTGAMRLELLNAARLNWEKVSPAIFGSMFQGVMDAAERRNLGAHYTSERNILRVIKPLCLDDLYAELAGHNWLDPARVLERPGGFLPAPAPTLKLTLERVMEK